MPKKKHKEAQVEQSARFKAEVERLIAAGDLNPTEADEALDRMLKRPLVSKEQEEKASGRA